MWPCGCFRMDWQHPSTVSAGWGIAQSSSVSAGWGIAQHPSSVSAGWGIAQSSSVSAGWDIAQSGLQLVESAGGSMQPQAALILNCCDGDVKANRSTQCWPFYSCLLLSNGLCWSCPASTITHRSGDWGVGHHVHEDNDSRQIDDTGGLVLHQPN